MQLVVAEGAPTYGGQALAMQMAQLGVPTTLIPDAAIFAMMARVNKVCCPLLFSPQPLVKRTSAENPVSVLVPPAC